MAYRIYGVAQLRDILPDPLAPHSALVKTVEIGVKRYQDLLLKKFLPSERDISVERALVAQILELLALVEMQV